MQLLPVLGSLNFSLTNASIDTKRAVCFTFAPALDRFRLVRYLKKRMNEGGVMDAMNNPGNLGAMLVEERDTTVKYKDDDVLVCDVGRNEVKNSEAERRMQLAVAESCRRLTGLLTSEDIKQMRKEKNMTQEQLAERMSVGIASIKRWETGSIQTRSMDQLLRHHLE
jgi:putative zinc finger/helix-turn-helix YgiT family protein